MSILIIVLCAGMSTNGAENQGARPACTMQASYWRKRPLAPVPKPVPEPVPKLVPEPINE